MKPAGPKVMATLAGWVRLDEAGHAVSAPIMERIERELADPLIGRVMSEKADQFPPLTFRPEEWRMAAKVVTIICDPGTYPLSRALREDDIMAATREIARGT